jgi:hypothetical protein
MNLDTLVAAGCGFLGAVLIQVLTVAYSRTPFAQNRAKQKVDPRPIDLDALPTFAIYEQGGEEPERCDCHGRPLVHGEEILVWPVRPQILCSDETRSS